MTNKVVNFNTKRAEKMEDARLWTPLDCLRDMVERVESGEIKNVGPLVIHWWELKDPSDPEGGKTHRYQMAGLTNPSHIALLYVALKRVVDDWMT